MSEREFTRLVDRSILPSLGRKLLFVFPLTNAQLDLSERKMSSNGSANEKHSEAMRDEIITAMSTACGIRIVLKKSLENICCPSYEMNAGFRNRRNPSNSNYHISTNNRQAIQKSCIDRRSDAWLILG